MIRHGLYSMTLEESAIHYSKTYVDPMNNLLTPEERTARRAAMVTGFLGGANWYKFGLKQYLTDGA